MKSLVAEGAAIVLVSSELPEVMNLSNRLYVMHRSQMVAELSGADINETEILSHFFREKRLEDGPAPLEQRDGDMMTRSTDHGGAAPNVALDRFYRLYGAIGFLPIMLVGLVVLFAIVVPHFLILPNVLNVLRSSSYLVILAVGQMLVLMVGGFDLSVGAVVALTSVSSALVMAGLKDQMADHPGPDHPRRRAGGARLRLSRRPGQWPVRGLPERFAFHGDPRHGLDRDRRRFAADQRHPGLWHAGRLCRRFRPRALAQAAERRLSRHRHRRRRLRLAEFHAHGPLHRRDRRQSAGRHRLWRSDANSIWWRPMCSARSSLRSAVLH